MLRLGLVFVCIQSAWCGIFDFTEVDDPFASIWNVNKQPSLKLTECRVQTESGLKFGVCTPHTNCLLTGGKPNGFCGLFSTCCVFENTCGKTSNTKVGYFEGSDVTVSESTCSYTVKLKNPNICQIRLDFVKFNLAPATLTKTVSSTYPIYKCADDVLKIHPNHYSIPDLCGNNDKQHVYIHVNQTDGVTKGVQLDVTLASRMVKSQLQSPSWKIKITQLECPGRIQGFTLPNDEAAQDFPLLAPLGAIQYFTDITGHIKSFGFDGSILQQSYTYDQKYAIAFKRDINICGVKFTPEYIFLQRDMVEFYSDANCKHYLFVPDLYFDNSTDSPYQAHDLVSKVCLTNNE
ncbi:hypothetical protein NQ315_009338, partial [Exocentrus adspersus]